MRFRFILLPLALVLLSACQGRAPQYPTARPPVAQNKGENLFLEAESYYRGHDYRRAYQTYAAYLQQNPQGIRANQARLREAELLGLLGDWQGSLNAYKDLLNRGVGEGAAYQVRYGIGRAYFKLGRNELATEVLESLTASDLPEPLRFSTNALLAEIALKKGEIEPAFLRLRLASRDLPAGDQEWFDNLKKRLVEQATPADLESLANLYRDSSLTAPMLLRLARLAQEGDRPEEARKWLQTLKERFPESKETQTSEKSPAPGHPAVGCLLPLTGSYAEYGKEVKQGMELAAQGTQLELVYRDCPNDPAQAARTVQDLSQDSRVLALLGPLTSTDAQAAAEAAQAAGLPLIGLSQKQNLTAAGSSVFQVFLTPPLQIRALLHYTVGERGLKRYAMFTPDSAYGRVMAQVFGDELTAQGGTLVDQATYPPDDQDLASSLSPLLTALQPGPENTPAVDALFVPDEAGTVAAIATQLAKSPLAKVQLLGSNLAHPKGQTGADQALNGIVFPDAFFKGDPNPAVQSFVSAYRQRFRSEPDYLAAQGYMVVRLMAHVLAGQNPPSRAELPQKFQALHDVPDLPWFKGFTSDRQAELALYILTIKNGQVEMATTPSAVQP